MKATSLPYAVYENTWGVNLKVFGGHEEAHGKSCILKSICGHTVALIMPIFVADTEAYSQEEICKVGHDLQ